MNHTSLIGWIDIAYLLLNRVRLSELLKDEVKVHVEPFCIAHGLQLDVVLLGYIEDTVRTIIITYF